jgi:hypothetical protein
MSMKVRTWAIVAVALGGLLLLLAVSLFATKRRAQEIYTQLDAVNSRHRQVEGTLRRLRSDVHVSGIFVRDYLLETSPSAGPEYRQQLSTLRSQTGTNLAALEKLVQGDEATRAQRLKATIDDYWEVFDPLFDWTPAEKGARSLTFLRREVLPRRDEVLRIAREIEALTIRTWRTSAPRSPCARRSCAKTSIASCGEVSGSERWLRSWPSCASAFWNRGRRSSTSGRSARKERCAACRRAWSARRKTSAAGSLASCTTRSARC